LACIGAYRIVWHDGVHVDPIDRLREFVMPAGQGRRLFYLAMQYENALLVRLQTESFHWLAPWQSRAIASHQQPPPWHLEPQEEGVAAEA